MKTFISKDKSDLSQQPQTKFWFSQVTLLHFCRTQDFWLRIGTRACQNSCACLTSDYIIKLIFNSIYFYSQTIWHEVSTDIGFWKWSIFLFCLAALHSSQCVSELCPPANPGQETRHPPHPVAKVSQSSLDDRSQVLGSSLLFIHGCQEHHVQICFQGNKPN